MVLEFNAIRERDCETPLFFYALFSPILFF